MDIPDIVKNKLIELDAENRQLKLDVARKESTIKNRDESLAELEEENRRLLSENSSFLKNSKDSSNLESRVAFLQTQLGDTQEELLQARNKCEELQLALNQRSPVRIIEERPIRSPTPPPIRKIEDEEEYKQLKEQFEDLQFDFSCLADKLRFTEEKNMEQERLAENLYGEISELQRALKEIREQKAELDAQLCDAQNKLPFASKGNSMFGEFVEQRKALEEDLKQLFHDCEALKKENYNLSNELEEARLMALRRTGIQSTVRCQCEDMRAELVRVRSRLENSESRIQSLNNEKIRSMEHLKDATIDRMLRAQYESLKREIELMNHELVDLRKEKDLLLDNNITLQAKLRRAENLEKMAKEDVSILTRQLELIKDRKAEEEELLKDEKSEDDMTAAEKIAKLIKAPPSIISSMVPSTPSGRGNSLNFKTPMPPSMSKGDHEIVQITTTPNVQGFKMTRFASESLNSEQRERRKEMMTATERRLKREKMQGPKRALPTVKPPAKISAFRMVVGNIAVSNTDIKETPVKSSVPFVAENSPDQQSPEITNNVPSTDDGENVDPILDLQDTAEVGSGM